MEVSSDWKRSMDSNQNMGNWSKFLREKCSECGTLEVPDTVLHSLTEFALVETHILHIGF